MNHGISCLNYNNWLEVIQFLVLIEIPHLSKKSCIYTHIQIL